MPWISVEDFSWHFFCQNEEKTSVGGRSTGNLAVRRGFVKALFFFSFPNSGHFPGLEKTAKFNLDFWPERVHGKPCFHYVPSTFFAKSDDQNPRKTIRRLKNKIREKENPHCHKTDPKISHATT